MSNETVPGTPDIQGLIQQIGTEFIKFLNKDPHTHELVVELCKQIPAIADQCSKDTGSKKSK